MNSSNISEPTAPNAGPNLKTGAGVPDLFIRVSRVFPPAVLRRRQSPPASVRDPRAS